jgi:hypothetical protein
MQLPEYLKSGEPARLFPALAETQKERRTLSIFLACLLSVREFRETLLRTIGRRIGARSSLSAYTEVVFKSESSPTGDRPDGLIVVTTGKNEWRALVEAKIGRNDLSTEQVERYLELAKAQKIDAVITISNQFTPVPDHHPCQPNKRMIRSVPLYHWSWTFIMTQAHLLNQNEAVDDVDQVFILSEFLRFLDHPSAGVSSFNSMNPEWKGVVETIRTGGRLLKNAEGTQNTVASWFQESQDLALKLAKKLEVPVRVRLKRSHREDPKARLAEGIDILCNEGKLRAEFDIPDAVDQLRVVCDARTRSVAASMRLDAPMDRKSTAARVNWLLRQIKADEIDGFFVRAFWPGRARLTQASLAELRVNPSAIQAENPSLAPTSFEVVYVREAGARFSGPRSFIEEVEIAAPEFYRVIGQNLRPWAAPAPKVKADTSHDDVIDHKPPEPDPED